MRTLETLTDALPRVDATIIIPTYDHGPLLSRALHCALNQTVRNIEVIIVGDGMTDETRNVAIPATRDCRVRLIDLPKRPNYGESQRHTLIPHCRGEIITYLADDDLWMPDHVACMREMLRVADVAHSLPLIAHTDGSIEAWTMDLSIPYFRRLMACGANRIPLAFTAHTKDAYIRQGLTWRTAPQGIGSVADFWLQCLANPAVRVKSGFSVTALKLQSQDRFDWSIEKRLAETDRWMSRIGSDGDRAEILRSFSEDALRYAAITEATRYSGPSWEVRRALLGLWRSRVSYSHREKAKRIPIVGKALTGVGERLLGPIAR